MYWLFLVGLTAAFVAISYRFNPRLAIGVVIATAFLLPVWCQFDMIGVSNELELALGLDLKVSVGTTCLILYCFMPGRTFPVTLVPCDFVMIFLVTTHAMSDCFNEGFTWILVPRIYAEWYVPYITGRLVIQKQGDISNFWKIMAAFGTVVGMLAVFEAFSYVNLYEYIFGPRPLNGVPRDVIRWGIKRSYGHSMHPLYLSVVLIGLLGWSFFGSLQSVYRRANKFWLFAPLWPILGIAVTGARSSILAIPIIAIATLFFGFRKLRWWIIGTTLIAGGFVMINREAIIVKLEQWGGERRGYVKNQIVVDGEVLSHSGTRNRLNLLAVYDIALRRSGLLGFGTENVGDFPPNVPLGPREVATLKKVKYIDNQFILITLRFGYLGLLFFAGAIFAAIMQLFYVGNQYPGRSVQRFCACIAAGLVGTSICLLTVWMPHEIGFLLCWTLGLSSAVMVAYIRGELSSDIADSNSRAVRLY